MFKVRRMKDKDEEAVVALLNANFPHVAMTREKLKERIKKGACFIVVEAEEELVGFADLRVGKNALLRGIAVRKDWVGKGAGTALVNSVMKEAVRLGKRSVWLKVRTDNSDAITFYKSNGFSIDHEDNDKLGEDVYIMVKRIEN